MLVLHLSTSILICICRLHTTMWKQNIKKQDYKELMKVNIFFCYIRPTLFYIYILIIPNQALIMQIPTSQVCCAHLILVILYLFWLILYTPLIIQNFALKIPAFFDNVIYYLYKQPFHFVQFFISFSFIECLITFIVHYKVELFCILQYSNTFYLCLLFCTL